MKLVLYKTFSAFLLIIVVLTGCAGARRVPKGNAGYRVQICFTESLQEAQHWHNRIEAEIRQKHYMVYTIFEAPYYKVRVGDFLLQDDAYLVQTWLRNALGYSDAWVVPSKVVIK